MQNENRMALLSALDDSQALFTGPGKMSTLGSLMRSESLVSDDVSSPALGHHSSPRLQLDPDSSGVQSTSSFQSASTVEEVTSLHLTLHLSSGRSWRPLHLPHGNRASGSQR